MSREFVKENDLECAGIDIPDRPLSDALNYATPNGLKLLKETIDSLEKERENLKKKKRDHPFAKQKFGAHSRNRTGHLFLTMEVLYQLSYVGIFNLKFVIYSCFEINI